MKESSLWQQPKVNTDHFGHKSLDFFLEMGLAADVMSITLEGFDSVFALLHLYSIGS